MRGMEAEKSLHNSLSRCIKGIRSRAQKRCDQEADQTRYSRAYVAMDFQLCSRSHGAS